MHTVRKISDTCFQVIYEDGNNLTARIATVKWFDKAIKLAAFLNGAAQDDLEFLRVCEPTQK